MYDACRQKTNDEMTGLLSAFNTFTGVLFVVVELN
jgi:hypothetical protein